MAGAMLAARPALSQGAFGAAAAPAAGPVDYRDPGGRYTLRLPAGWNTIQMNRNAVQFSSSGAFVSLLALPGSSLDMTLDAMGKSYSNQWKNFAEVRRGDANFSGRPAKYVTYSGTGPAGLDSYLQILAMTDGSTTFVLTTQAGKSDFTRMKGDFDAIERSFTLTAAQTPAAPPPSPAGIAETSHAPLSAAAGAAAAGSADAASPGGARADANGVYRMKLVRITDEHGFEQPMTALTLLIPVDWQFQGNVIYGQGTGCHANLVHLVFRATSPDGKLSVELLPGNVWQWTDDLNMRNMMMAGNQQMARFGAHGCDIMAPMTADEFLRRAVIPAMRRGARETGAESMPDAAARLQEEARTAQQTAARNGMRVNIRTSAGRIRLTYQAGSQPVEEWVTAMTTNIGMTGPAYNVRTGRAGQTTYYSSAADHIFAMRAPQGQLNTQERFFRLIMGTVRVDPQWEARVQQVIANLTQQDINGANQRAAIANQAGQEMSRMIHDAYQNATAGREHSMESWGQYMRGVQTFRNPNTGDTVELSNEYSHAWAGPDNSYVVTDSGSFNPNGSMDGRWTQLELVRK